MSYVISVILAYLFPLLTLMWGGWILYKNELRLSFSNRFVYNGTIARVFGVIISALSLIILITIIILGASELSAPKR